MICSSRPTGKKVSEGKQQFVGQNSVPSRAWYTRLNTSQLKVSAPKKRTRSGGVGPSGDEVDERERREEEKAERQRSLAGWIVEALIIAMGASMGAQREVEAVEVDWEEARTRARLFLLAHPPRSL